MNKLWAIYGSMLILLSSFNHFQIDKASFYKALSATSREVIDMELKTLDQTKQSSQVLAYRGALLMKKAGFEKGVKNKVKTFKQGAKVLEGEIEKNPANVEYRFLRLTIQEHAPGILKYDKNLTEDKALVAAGYGKLDASLRSIVLNYTKSSKVLKETELKEN